MNRFYRDRTRQIFEEVKPGHLRGVTDMTGAKYIQDQTVPKAYLESLRGPLVEVPDPWMTDTVKVLRVEDVVERWETHDGQGAVSDLLADIHAALGHQPEREEP